MSLPIEQPGAFDRSHPWWLWTMAAILPWCCVAVGIAQERAPAERALETLGLVNDDGQWRFREEPLLKRRLEQLDEMRVEFLSLHRTLDMLRADNDAVWMQIRAQVDSLQKRIAAQPTDSKERRSLEGQLKKLTMTGTPPEQLAGKPNVRPCLNRLLTLELDALRHFHWSRRTLAMIRERYPAMQASPIVGKHLADLNAKLGTAAPFREADGTLEAIRPYVDKPRSTIYIQAGHTRLGLVIDEMFPITVSHEKAGSRLLLAADIARTIRAEVDNKRQPLRVSLQKRMFTATPIIIPTVRLGSKTAKNVEAWQLPKEASDLGSIVGELAVEHWRIELQPLTMRAVAQAR